MSRPPLGIVFFGDSASLFSNRLFQLLYRIVEKKPGEYALKGVVDTPKDDWVSTNPAAISEEDSFLPAAASLGASALLPTKEALAPLEADLFVAVGYTQIVREPVLSLPDQYMVNFHASLLPAYRGKHPVFRALQAGEKWAGLSVHVMDTSLDTGPLLYQCRIGIKRRDSVTSLYQRIVKKSTPLMGRLLKDAQKRTLRPYPQSTEGASYFSSIEDEDFHIQFDQSAVLLEQRVYGIPGKCFFLREGKKVFLEKVRRSAKKSGRADGRISACTGRHFSVSVPGGNLIVQAVREDGYRVETGAEFLREKNLRPGMLLEGEHDG